LTLEYQGDRVMLDNKIYHQRGESIMPQGILSYKYEEEKQRTGMTALAGLPVYLDLASVMGISESIQQHLQLRTSQGWTDTQVILSHPAQSCRGRLCR